LLEETKSEVQNFLSEIVKTLVSLIEEKDMVMRGHAQRVASLCVYFSKKLKLSQGSIKNIYLAGLLHDIAMVYIPVEIFQKTGNLDEDEIAMIKQHPVMAEKILSNLTHLKEVLPIIRHHHEAFDGSGYPDGLQGDEIPLEARILCIVDSFDAMTSPRSNKPTMTTEKALRKIVNDAGKKFDKNLIIEFIDFIKSTGGTLKREDKSKEKAETESMREMVIGIVQKIKDKTIELPILPKSAQDIQSVMNQSSSSAKDIANVLERDAAISVRLIHIANSPVYRGSGSFYSVKQAIPRLGIKKTQSIVSAILNKNLYETKNEQFRLLMYKLWLHSLASAYCSRVIAKKLKIGDRDKLFLMGLIHDIGKPPLIKIISETIPQDELLNMGDITICIQEVHTSFGGEVLKAFGFPQEFIKIATQHEGPKFSATTEKEILMVNLASNIAHQIGYGLFDDEIELSNLESTKLLEIDPDELDTIVEETKKIMQNTGHLY